MGRITFAKLVAAAAIGMSWLPGAQPTCVPLAIPAVIDVEHLASLDLGENSRVQGSLSQYRPDDKGWLPVGYDADIRVGYVRKALYVVVHCFDPRPQEIVSVVCSRDASPIQMDRVAIYLDAEGSGQNGYLFGLNPDGVQYDSRVTESSGTDASFDLLWQSWTSRTADGYVVKFRIPYASVGKVTAKSRILVTRNLPREKVYLLSWPRMSRNVQGYLKQGAVLGGNIDVELPFSGMVVGSLVAGRYDGKNGSPIGQLEETREAGLDVRVRSQSANLDLTVNPDFSTVDADVNPLTVNTRYRVSLAEKRPFFLDGMATLTETGQVYTRAVLDPSYGVKAFGATPGAAWAVFNVKDKFGGNSVSSVDYATNEFGLTSSDTAFGAEYAFGKAHPGKITGIVTSVDFQDTSNLGAGGGALWSRSYGLSLNQEFLDSFKVSGTYLASTARLNFETPDPNVWKANTKSGSYAELTANYSTRDLEFSYTGARTSPDMRLDMGFLNIVNHKTDKATATYRYTNTASNPVLVNASFSLYRTVHRNWDNSPFSLENYVTARFGLVGRTAILVSQSLSAQETYQGLTYPESSTFVAVYFNSIKFLPGNRLILNYSFSKGIDYNNATRARLTTPGATFSGGWRRINYQAVYFDYRDCDLISGQELLRSKNLYLKAGLMLTPAWSIRTEYQILRDETYTVATRTRTRTVRPFASVLLRWQPNPFSGFYVGYTQERSGALTTNVILQTSTGNSEALVSKGLFAKLTWTWQF